MLLFKPAALFLLAKAADLRNNGIRILFTHHANSTEAFPQDLTEPQYTAMFDKPLATLRPLVAHEICVDNYGLKCYREAGRELWAGPLTWTGYSQYYCDWLCRYNVTTTHQLERAVPLKAILGNSVEAFDPMTHPTYCRNPHEKVLDYTSTRFSPRFSTLRLHIHYQLTTSEGKENVTRAYAVQLPGGGCDTIFAYISAQKVASIATWFQSFSRDILSPQH